MDYSQGDEALFMQSSCINAILEDNTKASTLDLDNADFENVKLRVVFATAMGMIEHDGGTDARALQDELRASAETESLAHLVEFTRTCMTSNAEFYARRLKEHSRVREANRAMETWHQTGDLDQTVARLLKLQSPETRYSSTAGDQANAYLENIDAPPRQGLRTGFPTIDNRMRGLHGGHLIVVAARPAVGKTALMLNLALNAGVKTLIVSAEQPADQCICRMMSSLSGVELGKVAYGPRSPDENRAVAEAGMKIKRRSLWFFDKPAPTAVEVTQHARKIFFEHGIEFVLVDYIQRLKSIGDAPRHEQIENSAMALKELARTLNIPVVALAQLNRESADNDPSLRDLKGSGGIEQEADVVWLLRREKAHNVESQSNEAAIKVAKNRHGPTGWVDLVFDEQTTTFREASRFD